MLVLSRKIGEAIIIDGRISVTVIAINGSIVRLGINAAPEIRIDREEIHKRSQEFIEPELASVGH